MQGFQFVYDPDWYAAKCSGYPEKCCPYGYDLNDDYDLHHHHYSDISVPPERKKMTPGGIPTYTPFDYQP